MKKQEYIGKEVRVKKNSKHPHAGEKGTVVRISNFPGVGEGLVVKCDSWGEEFAVFNLNHLQILQ